MLGTGMTSMAKSKKEADPKKAIENQLRQKVASGQALTPEETNYINTFMKGTKGEYVPPEEEVTGGGGLGGLIQSLKGKLGGTQTAPTIGLGGVTKPEPSGPVLGAGGGGAQASPAILNMLMQKLSGQGGGGQASPMVASPQAAPPQAGGGGVIERLKAALSGRQNAPAIGMGGQAPRVAPPVKPRPTFKQKTGNRQAAIKELKAAGAPVTEANIKAAMAQLVQ